MQYTAATGALKIKEAKERVLLAVVPAATVAFQLIEFGVSFNGTSPSIEPCRIDLFKSNRATNFTIGTKNTAVTLKQVRGGGNTGKQSEAIVASLEAGEGFSESEPPTALEVLKTWFVSPTSGLVYQAPLGRESEGPPSTTFALGIRVFAAKEVEARTYMEVVQGPS